MSENKANSVFENLISGLKKTQSDYSEDLSSAKSSVVVENGAFVPHVPHQMEKARSDQVRNNAGGYVFAVSDETRVRRFLILGADAPTFYTTERKLTIENAQALVDIIKAGNAATILNEIYEVNKDNRSPKQGPILFALALCARYNVADTLVLQKESKAEPESKKTKLVSSYVTYLAAMHEAALGLVPEVCRIPTHLFEFLAYAMLVAKTTCSNKTSTSRGFGRSLRNVINNWYASKSPRTLARLLTKYPQRNGWSHRDLFRLAHPNAQKNIDNYLTRPERLEFKQLYHYVVSGQLKKRQRELNDEELVEQTKMLEFSGAVAYTQEQIDAEANSEALALVAAYLDLKKEFFAPVIVEAIYKHKLNREHLPTTCLNEPTIWQALLQVDMPLTAMIRNLGKMSSINCLDNEHTEIVTKRMQDEAELRKARIHPLHVLLAKAVYSTGHGDKGKLTWNVNPSIVNALEASFYTSFMNAPVTGLRYCLALDVSGSMGANISGTMLSCREAAAAMATILLRNEEHVKCVGFSHKLVDLHFDKTWSMEKIVKHVDGMKFGSTDCAQPMLWASQKSKKFDVFIVYTDCETYFGKIHPYQALKDYRVKMGIDAKLVVMGMTATKFTIADPKDRGMLDIVGFDSAVPQILHEFLVGHI